MAGAEARRSSAVGPAPGRGRRRRRGAVGTPAQVFAALVEHLEVATNGGDVRPVATVLAPATPTSPGVRIWNSQLLHYARYRSPDGTIVGDPANVELTDRLLALGWPGGPGTPFDLLPAVARGMGLDTSGDRTLWEDRAHVELNVAVIHSFDAAGVRLSDHHAESRLFLQHVAREERRGRTVAADWSWIVPPLAGSTTPVFHRSYDTAVPDGPRLVQQAPAWAAPQEAAGGCPFAAAAASAGSHG